MYESTKLKIMAAAPRFSVGKTPTGAQYLFNATVKNPAPGNYDPNYQLVHQATRTAFTPSEQRPSFDKFGKTPGPGHYLDHKLDRSPTWK